MSPVVRCAVGMREVCGAGDALEVDVCILDARFRRVKA
jgi:hypothetical protein